jgi:1-deoxy-D-xylulose-5-phosphate reductoisomerase
MVITLTQRRPDVKRRSVTVLGATGSVGCNTIDLISRQPDAFTVEALTGNRNVALLAEQARRLRPKIAVVADLGAYRALKQELAGSGIEVAAGPEALIEAANRPAEWVMASIVGAAGLEPTLEAVRRGAIVGLANKECLVCAGDLMMAEIRRCGATVFPSIPSTAPYTRCSISTTPTRWNRSSSPRRAARSGPSTSQPWLR